MKELVTFLIGVGSGLFAVVIFVLIAFHPSEELGYRVLPTKVVAVDESVGVSFYADSTSVNILREIHMLFANGDLELKLDHSELNKLYMKSLLGDINSVINKQD